MCVSQQGNKQQRMGAMMSGMVNVLQARRDGRGVTRDMFTDPKGYRDRRRAGLGGAPLGGATAPLGA